MLTGASVPNVWSQLSTEDVHAIVLHCSDLTLQISDQAKVEAVFGSDELDGASFKDWIGSDLSSIVTPDSLSKVTDLLNDNAASPFSEARWRHLNFKSDTHPNLPLLVKFFQFERDGAQIGLICARDLRPVTRMQEQLQRELLSLERQMEEYRQKLI